MDETEYEDCCIPNEKGEPCGNTVINGPYPYGHYQGFRPICHIHKRVLLKQFFHAVMAELRHEPSFEAWLEYEMREEAAKRQRKLRFTSKPAALKNKRSTLFQLREALYEHWGFDRGKPMPDRLPHGVPNDPPRGGC